MLCHRIGLNVVYVQQVAIVDVAVAEGAKDMNMRVVMFLLFRWKLSLEPRRCMICRLVMVLF